jgi:hypothetical protein
MRVRIFHLLAFFHSFALSPPAPPINYLISRKEAFRAGTLNSSEPLQLKRHVLFIDTFGNNVDNDKRVYTLLTAHPLRTQTNHPAAQFKDAQHYFKVPPFLFCCSYRRELFNFYSENHSATNSNHPSHFVTHSLPIASPN